MGTTTLRAGERVTVVGNQTNDRYRHWLEIGSVATVVDPTEPDVVGNFSRLEIDDPDAVFVRGIEASEVAGDNPLRSLLQVLHVDDVRRLPIPSTTA